MDPSVEHLNGILAWVGGNLNNNFQKSQMPGGEWWSFDLTDTVPVWPYDDKTGFRDAKIEKKKNKPLTKEHATELTF